MRGLEVQIVIISNHPDAEQIVYCAGEFENAISDIKFLQSEYEKYGVKIVSFNALERGIGDPKAYVESLDFPFVAIADI